MSAATIDLAQLLGDSLVTKDGKFPVANLAGKVVALYFSAHWCPPCRAFTPSLIEAYKAAKAKNPNFELIFVSSDQDADEFAEYSGDMPWPSVDFEQEDVREAVGAAFGIKGIPSLQVVGKDGKLITNDGRTAVAKDKEEAFLKWASA